jgi:hypothetical protein
MKKVETFGNEQKVPKKDAAPQRVVCHICHGMGLKEKPNGDTFDCPNRSCNNGYIIIKEN